MLEHLEDEKNKKKSHVAKEIGVISIGEYDVKFNEAAFEFINSIWKEYEEELYYDAIS